MLCPIAEPMLGCGCVIYTAQPSIAGASLANVYSMICFPAGQYILMPPYMPCFLCAGRHSQKSDVYAFGIVLLELFTGQQALEPSRRNDPKLVDHVLPHLCSMEAMQVGPGGCQDESTVEATLHGLPGTAPEWGRHSRQPSIVACSLPAVPSMPYADNCMGLLPALMLPLSTSRRCCWTSRQCFVVLARAVHSPVTDCWRQAYMDPVIQHEPKSALQLASFIEVTSACLHSKPQERYAAATTGISS